MFLSHIGVVFVSLSPSLPLSKINKKENNFVKVPVLLDGDLALEQEAEVK